MIPWPFLAVAGVALLASSAWSFAAWREAKEVGVEDMGALVGFIILVVLGAALLVVALEQIRGTPP